MVGAVFSKPLHAHCRTGSSESVEQFDDRSAIAHCRTGSSEKVAVQVVLWVSAHCRTGSSESQA